MAFTGTLNSNEIFSSLYNMIISVQAFGDNIARTNSTLADKFRVDGSLYGDQKLYVATDALKSAPWGNDAEATNLLAINRPKAPHVQAVELDVFRQIALTVDEYLSKRAWGSEGAFSQFNNVLMGWIGDTKRVYDSTTVNAFVGTTETAVGAQSQNITIPEGATEEESNRLYAQTIATKMADIMVELTDPSRDYNDLGFLRSYRPEDLIVVWNAEQYNKIRKTDMPTIFHKDGLFDKMDEVVLPAKYFGTVNTGIIKVTDPNVSIRALVEGDYSGSSELRHCFAGELCPAGHMPARKTYTEDNTIVCKIVHKNAIPYMSAFEVGTSFFNPKSLTTNHYLTFGHNTLEALKNYPLITLRAVEAAETETETTETTEA